MTAALLTAAALVTSPGPQLLDLRVANGSTPFARDRALLTTVSPNADGFRDVAVVHVTLTRSPVVRLAVVATNMVSAGRSRTTVVWRTSRRFEAGRHTITWRPAPTTQPRTYIVRLRLRRRVYGNYGPGGRQDAPVVRIQGIDAGFTKRSYAPGNGLGADFLSDDDLDAVTSGRRARAAVRPRRLRATRSTSRRTPTTSSLGRLSRS